MHLQVPNLDEHRVRRRDQVQIQKVCHPLVGEKVVSEKLVVLVQEKSCVARDLNVDQLNVSKQLHRLEERPQERVFSAASQNQEVDEREAPNDNPDNCKDVG